MKSILIFCGIVLLVTNCCKKETIADEQAFTFFNFNNLSYNQKITLKLVLKNKNDSVIYQRNNVYFSPSDGFEIMSNGNGLVKIGYGANGKIFNQELSNSTIEFIAENFNKKISTISFIKLQKQTQCKAEQLTIAECRATIDGERVNLKNASFNFAP